MMKKITAIILSAILCLSCAALAEETEKLPGENAVLSFATIGEALDS